MAMIRCCLETEVPDVFETLVRKCTDPGCKYKLSLYDKVTIRYCKGSFVQIYKVSKDGIFISPSEIRITMLNEAKFVDKCILVSLVVTKIIKITTSKL